MSFFKESGVRNLDAFFFTDSRLRLPSPGYEPCGPCRLSYKNENVAPKVKV